MRHEHTEGKKAVRNLAMRSRFMIAVGAVLVTVAALVGAPSSLKNGQPTAHKMQVK